MNKVEHMKQHNYVPRTLTLQSISTHPQLQNRAAGTDMTTVNTYVRGMAKGDKFDPIKLASIGKNHYVLDGHHRLEAHRKAGKITIEALVARMSLTEAKRVALFSNTTHGKALSQKDKRALWEVYIADGHHLDGSGKVLSARQIASDLSNMYSFQTVSRLLREYKIPASREGIKIWTRDEGYELEIDVEEELEEDEAAHFKTFEDAIQKVEEAFAFLENNSTQGKALTLTIDLTDRLREIVNPRVYSLEI